MKNRSLGLFIALTMAITLSCSWLSPRVTSSLPTQSAMATSTSSPTQTSQPIATPFGDGYVVNATTAVSGRATITDPITHQQREIIVRDVDTGKGIDNIQVIYVTDGTDHIVFAVDPSGQYLSTIYEPENYGEATSPKLASLNQQGLATIVVTLTLLSSIQTVDDFLNLFTHSPRLEKWGWLYSDSCWTGAQMGQGISVLFGVASIVGIPGFSEIGKYFKVADEALLDMLRISQLGAEWDIQQRLSQLNGVLRLRVYNAPVPIVQPIGWCLSPLESVSARSIVDWLNYSFEHGDMFPLERLVTRDELHYVNYIEGGQSVTRREFMMDMQERLPNKPACDGYADNGRVLQVWTSNWKPPIAMTELCYIDCNSLSPPWESQTVAFLFYRTDNDSWTLETLWLNQPDEFSVADGKNLTGCDHVSEPSLLVSPTTMQTPPPLSCLGALPSRLVVDERAYVIPDPPIPNRVRSGPGRDYPVIGQAQPGATLNVLEGPFCADGWAWWKIQVEGSGLSGWTAEGDGQEYWLAPCSSPVSCPSP